MLSGRRIIEEAEEMLEKKMFVEHEVENYELRPAINTEKLRNSLWKQT